MFFFKFLSLHREKILSRLLLVTFETRDGPTECKLRKKMVKHTQRTKFFVEITQPLFVSFFFCSAGKERRCIFPAGSMRAAMILFRRKNYDKTIVVPFLTMTKTYWEFFKLFDYQTVKEKKKWYP